MKNKNNLDFVSVFLYILLCSLLFVGIFNAYDVYKNKELCDDAGFDYAYGDTSKAREGYVICCNKVYENNILQEPICEAVKK